MTGCMNEILKIEDIYNCLFTEETYYVKMAHYKISIVNTLYMQTNLTQLAHSFLINIQL